ncbi:hypothetical protein LguiA_026217 [Lonicera macranthoides]
MANILFLLLFFVLFLRLGSGQNECTAISHCKENGPAIRFPFRLKNHQPESCGYPGFEPYCDKANETFLKLSFSVSLLVMKIDYKKQVIQVYDPVRCLIRLLLKDNLSATPFQLIRKDYFLFDFSLYNCSAPERDMSNHVPCLDVPGYNVYAVYSDSDPLTSCTKIHDIASVPSYIFYPESDFHFLSWARPSCSQCEADNMICGFKNYSSLNNYTTEPETGCSPKPKRPKGISVLLACEVLGSFLFLLLVIVLYIVWSSNKTDRENQVKVEKFLADYRALKPARYSYADIKRITDQFKDKLGEGGYGMVYKGKLSDEIFVAVKVLNNVKGNGEEFINEVGTIGRIHHVHVVRLVGYCADGFRRALVYEFLPNDSLEKFIFNNTLLGTLLGWEKLQDIALGIARGIEYLHQGCDQRIVHFDIKPHNILLDQNMNPKISDFGHAKLCSKEHSAVSMTAARGTMGYIAPEVLSRSVGKVSCKSDVYSFGMLLLEMVGGRKNTNTKANTNQVYFPEWIYDHLAQGKELQIRIEEDGDAIVMKKLTIVGLWCIQWYPVDRPSMKEVVQMLEGEGENMSMPPNPFTAATKRTITNASPHGRVVEQELSVILELE